MGGKIKSFLTCCKGAKMRLCMNNDTKKKIEANFGPVESFSRASTTRSTRSSCSSWSTRSSRVQMKSTGGEPFNNVVFHDLSSISVFLNICNLISNVYCEIAVAKCFYGIKWKLK